ncbi:hypothetical protein I4U23_022576 [Adineta vaga]|nr:hypothetical protein I4U23_022576 [Adineta vaga]
MARRQLKEFLHTITLSKTISIAIFFGIASDGSFYSATHIKTACQSDFNVREIDVSDFNDDGFTDLLVDCVRPSNDVFFIGTMLNFGDGYNYRPKQLIQYIIGHIDSFVIGDFDNDRKQNDISFCGLNRYEYKVYALSAINYNNNFAVNIPPGNKIHGIPQSIIRGRFNDDELDDIALVAVESDTLHILLAYGDGTFLQQIYHTDNSPVSIVRINFNNDSIDDIAVLNCHQTISIYLGTKLGIFSQDKILFQISQNHTRRCFRSLKAVDLNQDGKDDLTFIDPDAQSIRVLLSDSCNKHF